MNRGVHGIVVSEQHECGLMVSIQRKDPSAREAGSAHMPCTRFYRRRARKNLIEPTCMLEGRNVKLLSACSVSGDQSIGTGNKFSMGHPTGLPKHTLWAVVERGAAREAERRSARRTDCCCVVKGPDTVVLIVCNQGHAQSNDRPQGGDQHQVG